MAAKKRESSFCDKHQNDAIILELFSQKQSSKFCDVIMKVCGKEFHAHATVLAAASPYFNSFLSQDIPRQFSQRSPQVIEIQIDGIEPNSQYEMAVSSVIDFIYTSRLTVDQSNVSQICEIARIMQIQSVVNFCELFQSNKTSTRVEAITVPPPDSGYFGSTNVANKMRHGQLVSNSTQVTPNLLGLDYGPKQTKEAKTQTLMKDFPKNDAEIPKLDMMPFKKRRGRKPTIVTRVDVETHTKESDREVSAGEEGDVEKCLVKTETEESENILSDIEEFCNAETEFIVNIIAPAETDTPAGVRRSSRARKPTPKILDSSKRKFSHSPVGAKSPKQIRPDPMPDTEAETNKDSSSLSSPCKDKNALSKAPSSLLDGCVEEANAKDVSGTELKEQQLEEPQIELAITEMQAEVEAKPETIDDEALCASLLQDPDTAAVVDTFIEAVDGDMKEKILSAKLKAKELDSQLPERQLRKKEKRRGRKPNPPKCRCYECGYTTNRIREMASHKKLHQLAKNSCIYCDREFGSKEELAEHMERHKGPLPYFCHMCDYRFRNKTQLNIHLPRHFDDKPFQCKLCSSSFKWRHALKSHMIVHSKKKDHLCDICGYASAHKSQLKAHRLIHSGNTFKCQQPGCLFQATKRQNLKYHMLSHSREKPHQCEVCGQAFSLVKNMRRHMRLHSADRPHVCSMCEYATTRFDKLKEHELKAHGLGTPPEKRIRIADLVLMHKYKQLQTVEEGQEEPSDSISIFNSINQQEQELIEIQPEQLQDIPLDEQAVSAATGSDHVKSVVDDDDKVNVFDVVRGFSTGESSLEVPAPITVVQEELSNGGSLQPKAMELVPGQTIIIQQTTETGDIQEIALPFGSTQTVIENSGLSSDASQNFTEIMIPANQVAEYMQQMTGQQITFVTQQ